MQWKHGRIANGLLNNFYDEATTLQLTSMQWYQIVDILQIYFFSNTMYLFQHAIVN